MHTPAMIQTLNNTTPVRSGTARGSLFPADDEPTDNDLSFATADEGSSAPLTDAEATERHSLGRVLVPLMKGVVYKVADDSRWDSLLNLQPRIQDHVSVLGLELILDEAEGYAYLRTRETDPDREDLPSLMSKRALSFPVSLLLALLRKRLVEIDVGGGDTRLILTRTEIVDMLRLFLPETSNEAKLIDKVDTHIRKAVELGFLRKLKVSSSADKLERYEVKRISRAFVDAQWLASFDERLQEYTAQLEGTAEPADPAGPPEQAEPSSIDASS